MAYCIAKTKAGKDCTAQAMQGSDYCYRHNPDISDDEKSEASRQGGTSINVLKDANPVVVRTIAGIVELIEGNINDVRAGRVDPRVSNAVVQNINTLLKVYEIAIADTRLRKLEDSAGIDSPSELVGLWGN